MPRRSMRVVKKDYADTLEEASKNNWRPKCHLQFWRFVDYPKKHEPTPEEAQEMCSGCPMLALCDEYAQTIRPPQGVWGGRVWAATRESNWVHGRPLPLTVVDDSLDQAA